MKRLWRLMTSWFMGNPPTASGPSAAKDVVGAEGWLEGRTFHSFGDVYELTIPDLPAFAKFSLTESVDNLGMTSLAVFRCDSGTIAAVIATRIRPDSPQDDRLLDQIKPGNEQWAKHYDEGVYLLYDSGDDRTVEKTDRSSATRGRYLQFTLLHETFEADRHPDMRGTKLPGDGGLERVGIHRLFTLKGYYFEAMVILAVEPGTPNEVARKSAESHLLALLNGFAPAQDPREAGRTPPEEMAQALAAVRSPAPAGVHSEPIPRPATPAQQAARAFLFAMGTENEAEFEASSLPDPGRHVLLGVEPRPADPVAFRSALEKARLEQVAPFSLDGEELSVPEGADPPVGTKTSLMIRGAGAFELWILPLELTSDGWKVDARFLTAQVKASREPPDPSAPEWVARMFLYHVLAKQPEGLESLSATAIRAADFTAANDLSPWAMDQATLWAEELPVAMAREGETFRMPSGEVVKGDANSETLLLVGLFGSLQVPFQLRMVEGRWKVVPQRYFEMLLRAGSL
jgi:hypothetical protein